MISNIYFIPKNFKILFLKKKKFFLILHDIYVKITVPIINLFKLNKYSNTVFNLSFSQFNLNRFFKAYSTLNLQTIKFKGKGFKLTKKRNVLNFLFNFSHMSYFVSKETLIKKMTKNKFTLINWNIKNLQHVKTKLINKRLVNIYNYNGLRLKRQIIHKRKGKTITS